MSREKLRIAQTEADNLLGNLRGEVGEVITSWVLMRDILAQVRTLSSGDIGADFRTRDLTVLRLVADRLEDDIVARLSELGEMETGRLNFHFAAAKFRVFEEEAKRFTKFVKTSRMRARRNQAISHKMLPERWSQHRIILIRYPALVRGVAMALRLMKRFDRQVLGPAAPYLWREMRKRRYKVENPPSAFYMIMPYIRLSREERARIIQQELDEGLGTLVPMETEINGIRQQVPTYPKWGGVVLGDRLLVLEEYPLISLTSFRTEGALMAIARDHNMEIARLIGIGMGKGALPPSLVDPERRVALVEIVDGPIMSGKSETEAFEHLGRRLREIIEASRTMVPDVPDDASRLSICLRLWSGCLSAAKTIAHETRSGPNDPEGRKRLFSEHIDPCAADDAVYAAGVEVACLFKSRRREGYSLDGVPEESRVRRNAGAPEHTSGT